jgi:hypothetical protein
MKMKRKHSPKYLHASMDVSFLEKWREFRAQMGEPQPRLIRQALSEFMERNAEIAKSKSIE